MNPTTRLRVELGLVCLVFAFLLYPVVQHDTVWANQSVPDSNPLAYAYRSINFPDGPNRVLSAVAVASAIGVVIATMADRKSLERLSD